jgi:hypothetical protein
MGENKEMTKKDFSELITEGDYEAVAKFYKEKKNSKGTGRNASVMYVITEGKFKDYGVFYNVNNVVHSDSPKAQEIAEKKLNMALDAAGVKQELSEIERIDIEELIAGKPVVITVKVRPEQTYEVNGETRTAKKANYVDQVTPL